MSALTVGLLLGIGSELVVEVASAGSAAHADADMAKAPVAGEIKFEPTSTEPPSISISRGQVLRLVNETDKSLEFETNGLLAREAYVAAHSQVSVRVTGPEGQYALSPEDGGAGSAKVQVVAGHVDAGEELVQILAAITTIEGHANAAHDLHNRAVKGKSPNPALDLKRASKHAHHPMHEVLESKTPHARLVQDLLAKNSLLDPIKTNLTQFSEMAGNKDVSETAFEDKYHELVSEVEQARRAIGGTSYEDPKFKAKVVLTLLELAEGEYKEAVEGGSMRVEQEAVPGKDAYLEYQDTRGFLKACKRILDKLPANDFKTDGQNALATLLDEQFKSVDPVDPANPTPFKEIEALFERIEKSVI